MVAVAAAAAIGTAAVVALGAGGNVQQPDGPGRGLWLGGFETGDLSQWLQSWQGRDRDAQFALTRFPSRDGGLAARLTVRPGDVYGASSGERSELALAEEPGDPEGQQRYYAWSTLFPPGWSEPRNWGAFVQWHSRFPVPAALALHARAKSVNLSLYTGFTDPRRRYARTWRILEGLGTGTWNDFVVSVRWSATDGAVQVWHRREGDARYRRVFAIGGVPTLQVDETGPSPNYLKLGLYRDRDDRTAVIYHDAMRRGLSLAQVVGSGPDPVTGNDLERLLAQDRWLLDRLG